MILFLDYDGVLHPDAAYWYRHRGVVLETAFLPEAFQHLDLFCYADALVDVLAEHRGVKIVLSTSWVSVMGFSRSVKRLPEALRERVVGSTYHTRYTPRWNQQTRYEQIREHVLQNPLSVGTDWIAIDNDNEGWPDDLRDHLVHTDDDKGIGEPEALERLSSLLEGKETNNVQTQI